MFRADSLSYYLLLASSGLSLVTIAGFGRFSGLILCRFLTCLTPTLSAVGTRLAIFCCHWRDGDPAFKQLYCAITSATDWPTIFLIPSSSNLLTFVILNWVIL